MRSFALLILVLQMSGCASLGSRLLDRMPGREGADRGPEATASSYQHGPGLGIGETGDHDLRVGLGGHLQSRLESSFFSRFYLDSVDRFGVSPTFEVAGCGPSLPGGLHGRGQADDLVTGLNFSPEKRSTRLSYRMSSDLYVGFSFSRWQRGSTAPSDFSLFQRRRTVCLESR